MHPRVLPCICPRHTFPHNATKPKQGGGGVKNEARVYSNVNVCQPKEYWDYESLDLEQFDDSERDYYEIVQKVGRGKYSEVFETIDVRTEERCIVKFLKPVRSNKLKRELKILQLLKGGPNVILLKNVIFDKELRMMSFIFEYVNNTDFRKLFLILNDFDIRCVSSRDERRRAGIQGWRAAGKGRGGGGGRGACGGSGLWQGWDGVVCFLTGVYGWSCAASAE